METELAALVESFIAVACRKKIWGKCTKLCVVDQRNVWINLIVWYVSIFTANKLRRLAIYNKTYSHLHTLKFTFSR